ncbi:MAG: NlpC/P60 family protein [Pseudomonadota bacterium]
MPRICAPLADVWTRSDHGQLARQFLLGDRVEIVEHSETRIKVCRPMDGYCGWIDPAHAVDAQDPEYWVRSFGGLAFPTPSLKAPHPVYLPFTSGLSGEVNDEYLQCQLGYVPMVQLTQNPVLADDPVVVAEKFLGVPYLWGGNSERGLDCSGLIQRAFGLCGITLPGDSADQWKTCEKIDTPQRGDMAFWTGHVAICADPETLVHATAFYMSVVYEPLSDALKRINAAGEDFLGYGRVSQPRE